MLTHGEDVEAHALKQRGWTISAIARHLGRDRKTVRASSTGSESPACEPARQRTRWSPMSSIWQLASSQILILNGD